MEVHIEYIELCPVQTKITDFFRYCSRDNYENQKRFWRDPLINVYLQRPRIWEHTYDKESIVKQLLERELERMRARGVLI